jgi:hypothetical protein
MLQQPQSDQATKASTHYKFGQVLGETSKKSELINEFPLIVIKSLIEGTSVSLTVAETFPVNCESSYSLLGKALKKVTLMRCIISVIWNVYE